MTRKLKLIITKKYGLMFFVLLSVVTLALAVELKNDESIVYKEVLKQGFFGNMTVHICDAPENKQLLMISNGDVPFIVVYKDSSDKITECRLVQGKKQLVSAEFEGGKFSKLIVVGNKRGVGLSVRFCDKTDRWGMVKYQQRFGDNYHDIDFDGQFDVKVFISKKDNEKPIPFIFMDGEWYRVAWLDFDTNEAGVLSAGEKVFYDFEFGKGWKRREEKK